jgi:hypothetical protein
MKFAGFLKWGALSDERTGLSFARVTVSSNKSVVDSCSLGILRYIASGKPHGKHHLSTIYRSVA